MLNVLFNPICSSGSIYYRMFPPFCLFSDACVPICQYEYARSDCVYIAEETGRREQPIVYTPRRTNWMRLDYTVIQYIQRQFIRTIFFALGGYFYSNERLTHFSIQFALILISISCCFWHFLTTSSSIPVFMNLSTLCNFYEFYE